MCSRSNYNCSFAVSECTITEPLTISPFNATTSYNFRGSCELTALGACDDISTEADFSIRVDFISDTMANGAVGVYKDGLRWISREDGSFFSDIVASSTSSDSNALEFSDIAITVMLNVTAMRTVIVVGDGIGVTVVHYYGGK